MHLYLEIWLPLFSIAFSLSILICMYAGVVFLWQNLIAKENLYFLLLNKWIFISKKSFFNCGKICFLELRFFILKSVFACDYLCIICDCHLVIGTFQLTLTSDLLKHWKNVKWTSFPLSFFNENKNIKGDSSFFFLSHSKVPLFFWGGYCISPPLKTCTHGETSK